MEGVGRKILGVGSRLGLLAALLLMVADVAPASAGTLNVQLGTTTTGCIAGSWFATGLTGKAYCDNRLSGLGGWGIYAASPSVSAGATGKWQINAPAGITIDTVTVPYIESSDLVSSSAHGWQAADYWSGGSTIWGPNTTSATEGENNYLNSSYYGFRLYCYSSSCNNQGFLDVPQIDLTATENQGPALTAVGSNNLWYQAGHYVWNPAGDPWSIALSGSDVSGVCNIWAYAAGTLIQGPTATPETDSFQQCPSPVSSSASDNATVDTDQPVPVGTSGSFNLQLNATNAASVTSTVSESIEVDNVQPTVSMSTPNDSNPGGWSVNHAVTVDATAHTGPSGLASLDCGADGGAMKPYTSAGVSVDGNGKHTVTCTAANGAVDPQGQPNTGSATMTIDIDEQPPSLSFESRDPSNPTQVVVDTSDSESHVAGGQIEMAPQGTSNWTSLPTSFTSTGQLIATIPDGGLSGPYTIQATACSQVGNCGSTSEALTMPLRLAASSDVSFAAIVDPLVAKKIKERVRVGWHWAAVLRHGKAVKVKRGGHWKTITVIKMVQECTRKRVKTGKHHWKLTARCRAPKIRLRSTDRAAYGHHVTVHGLLVTSQDVPIADTSVRILTAPNNGLGQYAQAATVTTNAGGAWSATLPAGPSRLIEAAYGGSATLLPATGQATLAVPARISMSISPRTVSWSGWITIRGQLDGGYVPPDGVALRVMIQYPGHGGASALGLPGLRTTPTGTFSIRWSYHAGRGVATYPIWVATDSTESDYAFAASAGRRISVTFGRAAAAHHRSKRGHHKRHKQRRR
jgi:hypothetical protein